jgi:hypothetical protein
MAAADYTSLVQSLYVSYYGRPADSFGLANFAAQLDALKAPTDAVALADAYGTNSALKSLIDGFGAAQESKDLYGTDALAFVTAVYHNAFNREPDFDGLVFWTNAIRSGGLQMGNAALAIVANAAKNTTPEGQADAKLIATKIAVATNFTAAIDTGAELAAYNGNDAAATARDMLRGVTAGTVAADFQLNVAATLESLVNHANPGATAALTLGQDELVGTANNDIFNAKLVADVSSNMVESLSAVDTIDGGAGKDTLNVTLAGGFNSGALIDTTSVETINIKAGSAVNANFANDVTTLGASGLGNVTISGRGLSTINASGDADVTVTGTAAASVSINVANADFVTVAVTATAPTATNKPVSDVKVAFAGELSVTADTVETLAVTAQGNGSFADSSNDDFVLTNATNLTTATVAGKGDVAVAFTTGGAALTKFDASALNGGVLASLAGDATTSVLASVAGGQGDNDLTVTNLKSTGTVTTAGGDDVIALVTAKGAYTVDAGAGNDNITIGNIVATKAAVINGGDGNDTINTSAAAASYSATGATLAVNAGAGNDFVIADDIAAAKTTVTFDGGAGTDTIRIGGLFGIAEAARVSGFEKVDVTANTNTTGLDLSRETSFNTVVLRTGTTAATVYNVAAGTAVEFKGSAHTNSAVGSLTYNLADASGDADSVGITITAVDGNNNGTTGATGVAAAEGNTTGALVVNGIETVSVTSSAVLDADNPLTAGVEKASVGSDYQNVLTLTGDVVETLNVSGIAGVKIDITAATAITAVDATANTGGVEIDLAGTMAATFNGGSAADTVTGGGSSIITANAGGDSITVTGGDTVVFKAAADSKLALNTAGTALSTVAAFDNITGFATGADHIDLTSLGLAINDRVAIKAIVVVDAAATLLAMAQGTASVTTGFFKNNTVNDYFAIVSDGGDSYLVVDANKDGNFNAASDLVVQLVGGTAIATTDIVLSV